jgi:hypothetical protein
VPFVVRLFASPCTIVTSLVDYEKSGERIYVVKRSRCVVSSYAVGYSSLIDSLVVLCEESIITQLVLYNSMVL